MDLIGLVIHLIIIGVILFLINMIPMNATIKNLINIVVIVCTVIWLLNVFFGPISVPIPHYRR